LASGAVDRGDYVLDNLNPAILPWTQTGYRWIAREVPGQAQWVLIGPANTLDRQFASSSITAAPHP
jgi:hypothetical protein